MTELANLAQGFGVALTLPNLGFMLVGIILGVLTGVLPGLGGANCIPIHFFGAAAGQVCAQVRAG